MSRVYQVTATRLVRIEVIADNSDDAWDVADASPESDWEEYGFEIQEVECVSGSAAEYCGPDRHGE